MQGLVKQREKPEDGNAKAERPKAGTNVSKGEGSKTAKKRVGNG